MRDNYEYLKNFETKSKSNKSEKNNNYNVSIINEYTANINNNKNNNFLKNNSFLNSQKDFNSWGYSPNKYNSNDNPNALLFISESSKLKLLLFSDKEKINFNLQTEALYNFPEPIHYKDIFKTKK